MFEQGLIIFLLIALIYTLVVINLERVSSFAPAIEPYVRVPLKMFSVKKSEPVVEAFVDPLGWIDHVEEPTLNIRDHSAMSAFREEHGITQTINEIYEWPSNVEDCELEYKDKWYKCDCQETCVECTCKNEFKREKRVHAEGDQVEMEAMSFEDINSMMADVKQYAIRAD